MPADALSWLTATWPQHDWRAARLTHGAFHEVAVLPEVVARLVIGGDDRARAAREVRCLHLAGELGLPVAVPALVDGPVTSCGRSGMLVSTVPGESRVGERWSEAFLPALQALGSAPVPAELPAARAWCGGAGWPGIVEALSGDLADDVAAAARRVVGELVASEAGRCVVHGDFGLHNVLWTGARISGLIDLDHLAVGDPAIDVAPLIGAFGVRALAGSFDADLLRRGMLHRACLPLQVAAGAQLAGLAELRDHALRNFADRWRDGTTYDPAAIRPGEL